ncbi:hypothetical protein [Polaribacter cellanae]|uniref:Uncharacterized protein n=1 Tax=Polaribacter cellanae TaxID=2818493 RepID=A0A975CQ92_9FLAO|nr:hypothetical protein [Polaribacter cellanae]QTE23350.1 hypothetical protein J3359_03460 [Polaribacter cellanae]
MKIRTILFLLTIIFFSCSSENDNNTVEPQEEPFTVYLQYSWFLVTQRYL